MALIKLKNFYLLKKKQTNNESVKLHMTEWEETVAKYITNKEPVC